MKEDVLVSIIVPVYNVEAYIQECVCSVLEQGYRKIELILVDDGSKDNSGQICDKYAEEDERIKVIHQKNGGLSVARNTGLSQAQGKYVYFLDSDDYIEKGTIEILVDLAERTNSDVVFFDAKIKNENKSNKYNENFYTRQGEYSNPTKGSEAFYKLNENNEFFTAVPLLFIRREVLEKDKLAFYEDILHEDELFTFNLFMCSDKVVHLPMSLYNRRVREESIMTSKVKAKNYTSLFVIFNQILNMYDREAMPEEKGIIKIQLKKIFNIMNDKYALLPFSERKKVKKLRKEVCEKIKKYYYFDDQDIYKKCHRSKKKEFLIATAKKMKIADFIVTRRNDRKQCAEFSYIFEDLKKTKKDNRIILIGTPLHGNLGDHAIAVAEKEFLKCNLNKYKVIEIPTPVFNRQINNIRKFVKNEDVIVVSGGGWLGDVWLHNENCVRRIVKMFNRNRVVIFPQTVYFTSTEKGETELNKSIKIFNKHRDLHLFLREKNSYEFCKKTGYIKNIYLSPDMVLFGLNIKLDEGKRDGCLFCFRKDKEKVQLNNEVYKLSSFCTDNIGEVKWTTTVYLKGISVKDRIARLKEKLEEYASAKIVVTDRLHSMIFAILTGTPCVALDNLTHKIKGVYKWVEDCEYVKVANSTQEAYEFVKSFDLEKIYSYNGENLKNFYFDISKIIKAEE